MEKEKVQEIIRQLACNGLNMPVLLRMGFKRFVQKGEDELRVHFKKNGLVVNVDIRYNGGSDLYDIQAHKFRGPVAEDLRTEEYEGVFCDQFAQIFASIFQVREENMRGCMA